MYAMHVSKMQTNFTAKPKRKSLNKNKASIVSHEIAALIYLSLLVTL